jgi:hypothetical protein
MKNTQATTYRGIDGVEYRELIRPKRIVIVRAEGLAELCDKPQECRDWFDANVKLRLNSTTAPTGGGYDKHDFTVTFEDGLEYEGRYDLKHWSVERPDLAKHVRSFLRWCAFDGEAAPRLKSEQVEAAKRFLQTYDVGQYTSLPVAS